MSGIHRYPLFVIGCMLAGLDDEYSVLADTKTAISLYLLSQVLVSIGVDTPGVKIEDIGLLLNHRLDGIPQTLKVLLGELSNVYTHIADGSITGISKHRRDTLESILSDPSNNLDKDIRSHVRYVLGGFANKVAPFVERVIRHVRGGPNDELVHDASNPHTQDTSGGITDTVEALANEIRQYTLHLAGRVLDGLGGMISPEARSARQHILEAFTHHQCACPRHVTDCLRFYLENPDLYEEHLKNSRTDCSYLRVDKCNGCKKTHHITPLDKKCKPNRLLNICPYCGQAGHKTPKSKHCFRHNPKFDSDTLRGLFAVPRSEESKATVDDLLGLLPNRLGPTDTQLSNIHGGLLVASPGSVKANADNELMSVAEYNASQDDPSMTIPTEDLGGLGLDQSDVKVLMRSFHGSFHERISTVFGKHYRLNNADFSLHGLRGHVLGYNRVFSSTRTLATHFQNMDLFNAAENMVETGVEAGSDSIPDKFERYHLIHAYYAIRGMTYKPRQKESGTYNTVPLTRLVIQERFDKLVEPFSKRIASTTLLKQPNVRSEIAQDHYKNRWEKRRESPEDGQPMQEDDPNTLESSGVEVLQSESWVPKNEWKFSGSIEEGNRNFASQQQATNLERKLQTYFKRTLKLYISDLYATTWYLTGGAHDAKEKYTFHRLVNDVVRPGSHHYNAHWKLRDHIIGLWEGCSYCGPAFRQLSLMDRFSTAENVVLRIEESLRNRPELQLRERETSSSREFQRRRDAYLKGLHPDRDDSYSPDCSGHPREGGFKTLLKFLATMLPVREAALTELEKFTKSAVGRWYTSVPTVVDTDDENVRQRKRNEWVERHMDSILKLEREKGLRQYPITFLLTYYKENSELDQGLGPLRSNAFVFHVLKLILPQEDHETVLGDVGDFQKKALKNMCEFIGPYSKMSSCARKRYHISAAKEIEDWIEHQMTMGNPRVFRVKYVKLEDFVEEPAQSLIGRLEDEQVRAKRLELLYTLFKNSPPLVALPGDANASDFLDLADGLVRALNRCCAKRDALQTFVHERYMEWHQHWKSLNSKLKRKKEAMKLLQYFEVFRGILQAMTPHDAREFLTDRLKTFESERMHQDHAERRIVLRVMEQIFPNRRRYHDFVTLLIQSTGAGEDSETAHRALVAMMEHGIQKLHEDARAFAQRKPTQVAAFVHGVTRDLEERLGGMSRFGTNRNDSLLRAFDKIPYLSVMPSRPSEQRSHTMTTRHTSARVVAENTVEAETPTNRLKMLRDKFDTYMNDFLEARKDRDDKRKELSLLLGRGFQRILLVVQPFIKGTLQQKEQHMEKHVAREVNRLTERVRSLLRNPQRTGNFLPGMQRFYSESPWLRAGHGPLNVNVLIYHAIRLAKSLENQGALRCTKKTHPGSPQSLKDLLYEAHDNLLASRGQFASKTAKEKDLYIEGLMHELRERMYSLARAGGSSRYKVYHNHKWNKTMDERNMAKYEDHLAWKQVWERQNRMLHPPHNAASVTSGVTSSNTTEEGVQPMDLDTSIASDRPTTPSAPHGDASRSSRKRPPRILFGQQLNNYLDFIYEILEPDPNMADIETPFNKLFNIGQTHPRGSETAQGATDGTHEQPDPPGPPEHTGQRNSQLENPAVRRSGGNRSTLRIQKGVKTSGRSVKKQRRKQRRKNRLRKAWKKHLARECALEAVRTQERERSTSRADGHRDEASLVSENVASAPRVDIGGRARRVRESGVSSSFEKKQRFHRRREFDPVTPPGSPTDEQGGTTPAFSTLKETNTIVAGPGTPQEFTITPFLPTLSPPFAPLEDLYPKHNFFDTKSLYYLLGGSRCLGFEYSEIDFPAEQTGKKEDPEIQEKRKKREQFWRTFFKLPERYWSDGTGDFQFDYKFTTNGCGVCTILKRRKSSDKPAESAG